jgi:hypothetical protein
MKWTFWKKGQPLTTARAGKLPKPKELPNAVGRKLVVGLQMDPDEAWSLRYVSRPSKNQPDMREFRLFDPAASAQAGLRVKDWHSLDDHSDLILYEGCHDRYGANLDLRPGRKVSA